MKVRHRAHGVAHLRNGDVLLGTRFGGVSGDVLLGTCRDLRWRKRVYQVGDWPGCPIQGFLEAAAGRRKGRGGRRRQQQRQVAIPRRNQKESGPCQAPLAAVCLIDPWHPVVCCTRMKKRELIAISGKLNFGLDFTLVQLYNQVQVWFV